MVTKARKRVPGARRGRPPAGLERVKFFVRAAPADVDLFRAVRAALLERDASIDPVGAGIVHPSFVRTISDAEVFHLAVQALIASLPPPVRARLDSQR